MKIEIVNKKIYSFSRRDVKNILRKHLGLSENARVSFSNYGYSIRMHSTDDEEMATVVVDNY